jgi:hypothetical protein
MVAQAFDGARAAWTEAGREGAPRLVAIAYFALGDLERGRHDVADYYSYLGPEMSGGMAAGVHGTADAVREAVRAFAEIGADELIFNPATDDVKDVARLAELVL